MQYMRVRSAVVRHPGSHGAQVGGLESEGQVLGRGAVDAHHVPLLAYVGAKTELLTYFLGIISFHLKKLKLQACVLFL